LLLGIIAIVRTQDSTKTQELLDLIQSGVPLRQLSFHVESVLATSPELSEARQRLSLEMDSMQDQPMVPAISTALTELVQEPARVSGLPMNAQIILDVD
jgi:hypothetical protein